MEKYTPVPNKRENGKLIFPLVQFHKTYISGKGRENNESKPLDPREMWNEARWVLVRRIYGQEFIRRLFFKVITAIWELSGEIRHGFERSLIYEES